MHGAIAQLGERLLCKQEVTGSIPVSSTTIDQCGVMGEQCGVEWCFELLLWHAALLTPYWG